MTDTPALMVLGAAAVPPGVHSAAVGSVGEIHHLGGAGPFAPTVLRETLGRRAGPVVLHAADRPVPSRDLFERVIAAGGDAELVVPTLDVVDTVRDDAGRVVDREDLVRLQTPWFVAGELLARCDGPDVWDALLAAAPNVGFVEGEPENVQAIGPAGDALAHAIAAGR